MPTWRHTSPTGTPRATCCSTDVICSTEKRCFFTARPPGRLAGLCRRTRPQAGPKNPEPLIMTDVNRDDTTLVRRAIGGDGDALEQLVQGHQTWVYNVAVRMRGHPHDAEDATQEIFIKAVTRLASFQGRSSFQTWLYRIAVNHVLNTSRRCATPGRRGEDQLHVRHAAVPGSRTTSRLHPWRDPRHW